jgi:limonene-1,2-epoxide hydrolase
VTPSARQVIEAVLAARNAGSTDQTRALLAPDATYWDCLGGQVRGAEPVAEALVTGHAGSARPRFVAETLAAAGGHAVVELRVCHGESSEATDYPATEVYELRAGLVVGCRVYLDPADVRAA